MQPKILNRLSQHRLALFTVVLGLGFLVSFAATSIYAAVKSPELGNYYSLFSTAESYQLQSAEKVDLETFQEFTYEIPAGFSLVNISEHPRLKVEQNSISFVPRKNDTGNYTFTIKSDREYSPVRKTYEVNVYTAKFDTGKLMQKLKNLLGNDLNHFGIHIYDLQREQAFGLNHTKIFPPASISKIPAAVLTLRDIDAGKRKLTDTYAIQNKYKHGTTDELAKLAPGTKVTIKELIDRLILESNNTAQYHLRGLLGGSFEALNPRTIKELNANPFFENPLQANAKSVSRVFRDIYHRKTLSDESASYLLGLLKNTPPDLKLAIPSGVPEGTVVANKVGFLFGGLEGDTYSDAAIVYGPKTDYVLVVLNDDAPRYPRGAEKISEISTVVYKHLQ